MSNTVTVDAAVLQDLIWNAQLAAIGQGEMDTTVQEQTAVLQACIDSQVGDADAVYQRTTGDASGIELAFIPADDPKVVALFGVRS